jgi:hypothetical protein
VTKPIRDHVGPCCTYQSLKRTFAHFGILKTFSIFWHGPSAQSGTLWAQIFAFWNCSAPILHSLDLLSSQRTSIGVTGSRCTARAFQLFSSFQISGVRLVLAKLLSTWDGTNAQRTPVFRIYLRFYSIEMFLDCRCTSIVIPKDRSIG